MNTIRLGQAFALVVGITSITSSVQATCSCMFRMRPPPTVTQDTSATSDPSYNPASAVFVTRQGTRTVLTMETVYSGPPVELSMLIPVPTSIERDHVRTVTGSIFRNLDRRTSPRVRHVWPACRRIRRAPMRAMSAMGGGGGSAPEPQMRIEELGIEIEDEWEVDEYDITLLGADESTGLLTFLRQRGLDLKENAIPMLRAYIESDHRFVLARVDPSRANVLGDKMMLSPIQLEYESEELRVPVRLGTLNSPGQQELLLYILSDQGRFEIANRTNVTAPTDLRMRSSVRGGVAEVYASLTDEVFRQHPGAAITEFAHVLGSRVPRASVRELGIPTEREAGRTWTLTRIRHRYGIELDDDLTLRPAAEPLRMTRRWPYPELRVGARSGQSAFHVQFAVIHSSSCPDTAVQQRYARNWATAESMWDLQEHVWPGEVFLDPIESLDIEPGSSAPPGWPPPPPPPPPPSPSAPDEAPAPAEAPPATEPAPPADALEEPEESADDSGFCAASPGSRGPAGPWLLIGLAALAVGASRRRTR
ncbi:MAG: DUF2330 domain-containing protein [Sandaracinaceae bacterium]|nr:DUF2330 domain-containing protein [Sandaracinaceae bacterium]